MRLQKTMTIQTWAGLLLSLLSIALAPGHASAAVTEQEAARLGTELTPMGADPSGNADGSIPPWRCTMRGLPEGLAYEGWPQSLPDPYAEEKPLFTIDADNYAAHQERLSEGQVALFQRYPDTYKMHVYPSHREACYTERVHERVRYNAVNAELYNGFDGIRGFTGSAAFPIPKNGAEVMWNARVGAAEYKLEGLYDDTAVFPNGTRSIRNSNIWFVAPYSFPDTPVGHEEPELGVRAAYIFTLVHKPVRDKGLMTMIHEPFDYISHKRAVWRYFPGQRRVRQAPNVGYDTPDGPGGVLTVDDTLGFNGAMDRFDWKLLGKREIYIPYHAYKSDDPTVSFDQLLATAGHLNPEYQRYELHRVWVVEATLAAGKRHVYAKRRFYIDEDSWFIALAENFDGRGELWKVVKINTLYDFDIQGYVSRSNMFHDLRSGTYVATRLINEYEPFKRSGDAKPLDYFTPQNLRKLGRR